MRTKAVWSAMRRLTETVFIVRVVFYPEHIQGSLETTT